MAKDLRGFWKPPLGTERARKAEAKYVRAKIKPRKKSKPSANPKIQKSDRFYESLNWRQLRMVVLKNCDGRCMCCGASAKDGIRIHVDHIKPRSTHPHLELALDNMQVLCEDCNIGKGGWDDTDWRVKM